MSNNGTSFARDLGSELYRLPTRRPILSYARCMWIDEVSSASLEPVRRSPDIATCSANWVKRATLFARTRCSERKRSNSSSSSDGISLPSASKRATKDVTSVRAPYVICEKTYPSLFYVSGYAWKQHRRWIAEALEWYLWGKTN